MSKMFEFNPLGEACPICNKKTIKESLLIGIAGTEEGRKVQAAAVHLDCVLEHARFYPNLSMIIIPGHDYDPS